MRGIPGESAGLALARPSRAGLAAAARGAADAACRYLLNRQTSHGHWVGELQGDSTLLSDYVLLQLWLHQPDADGDWNPPSASARRVAAACKALYPGGPSNASASSKAYFALRLGGMDPSDGPLRRARDRILDLGGVEAANSYTKLYLSYFGLFPRSGVPSIPPEIFLLPDGNRFSVYSMSSWSRAMLAPLAILDATAEDLTDSRAPGSANQ